MSLFARALLVCAFTLPGAAQASEVDVYTHGHVELTDASPILNNELEKALRHVIDEVNVVVSASADSVTDKHVEWLFFQQMARHYVTDVAYGYFERCIASNQCPGWAPVERLAIDPQDSIYAAANWRFTPAQYYLASVVNVCGVRMGADKLTHFIDDAFRYYNATRLRRPALTTRDVERLSLAFERAVMGTKLTGVISHADVAANVSGVDFYYKLFHGAESYIRRNGATGTLVLERTPDFCDYVDPRFSETMLPNEFVFGPLRGPISRSRRIAMAQVVSARVSQASNHEAAGGAVDLVAAAPEPEWRNDYPRWRIAWTGIGFVNDFLWKRDFRQAVLAFHDRKYFTRRGFERRKDISIRQTSRIADATFAADDAQSN